MLQSLEFRIKVLKVVAEFQVTAGGFPPFFGGGVGEDDVEVPSKSTGAGEVKELSKVDRAGRSFGSPT